MTWSEATALNASAGVVVPVGCQGVPSANCRVPIEVGEKVLENQVAYAYAHRRVSCYG